MRMFNPQRPRRNLRQVKPFSQAGPLSPGLVGVNKKHRKIMESTMSKYWGPPWMYNNPVPSNDPAAKLLETLVQSLIKAQRKQNKKDAIKKPDEKKDEKKPKTFTYFQTAFLCLALGIPTGAVEIFILKGFAVAFLNALRVQLP